MTTKKIVMIVVGILLGLCLVVAVFVGGIIGIAFYSVSNSEAATAAKDFLRPNARLKQDIGEVKDFGNFMTGNVNFRNGNGDATLNIKVIGERATVNATLDLIYRSGRWRVIAASYRNSSGQDIDLLNPYESQRLIHRLAGLAA
jgi:cytochrome oxidase complex assembly protein 1